MEFKTVFDYVYLLQTQQWDKARVLQPTVDPAKRIWSKYYLKG